MGWWPWGGQAKQPDMSVGSRTVCYDHRDEYFACLEKNGEASTACSALGKKYNETCHPAWVKYFNIQRSKLTAQGQPWRSPNMEGAKGTKIPLRT
ncbi:hypothetical protein T484DRAFT_1928238 [Baffinella frigidus]|nr:hypothetical protein T484DRAFT_1928238 [Cryptophyta sp. CCMP2293]